MQVAAEFRCRGDDLLGIYADAIRERNWTRCSTCASEGRFRWLSGLPFLNQLSELVTRFRCNPAQVCVTNDNGKLHIRLTGPWREVIMWEVPLLCGRDPVSWFITSLARNAGVDQALDALEVTEVHCVNRQSRYVAST